MFLLISLISCANKYGTPYADISVLKNDCTNRLSSHGVFEKEPTLSFMKERSLSNYIYPAYTLTNFGIKYTTLTLSDLSTDDSKLLYYPDISTASYSFFDPTTLKSDRSLNDLIRDGPPICQNPLFMKYFIWMHPAYYQDADTAGMEKVIVDMEKVLPEEYVEIFKEYVEIFREYVEIFREYKSQIEILEKNDKETFKTKVMESGETVLTLITSKFKTTPLTIPYDLLTEESTLGASSYTFQLTGGRILKLPLIEYKEINGKQRREVAPYQKRSGDISGRDTTRDISGKDISGRDTTRDISGDTEKSAKSLMVKKTILYVSIGMIGLAALVGVILFLVKQYN